MASSMNRASRAGTLYSPPISGVSLVEVVRRNAEEALAQFVGEASKAGVRIRAARADRGSPAHAIVDAAKLGNYDLIVLGTHGRTGLSHMLIGSVAERVVRHAPCPVLSVRARSAA
jgi:universal stress protein A